VNSEDEIPAATDYPSIRPTTGLSEASAQSRSSDVLAVRTHKIIRARPLPFKSQDPAQCLDIIDDMYAIYYDLEDKYSAKPYMKRQKDVSPKMRCILVDWLIEVHYKFRLVPATLWLTINIIDRYLEIEQVQRTKLQLIGVTALFIACKFEEVFPPEVSDCVYITDNAYDKAEILQVEKSILIALDYQVFIPTGFHFLNRYFNASQASERTRLVASYYAERNLQECDMLTVAPHIFAAASLYAALKQESMQYTRLNLASCWNRILQEESGLQESDIIPTARIIIQHVSEEVETASRRRLIAAKKKYSAEKHYNISSLPLPVF
jgi:cyclin B